jgi:hypothetical protein
MAVDAAGQLTLPDKGIEMIPNNRKLIAAIGATGQQGGGVVLALKGGGRIPGKRIDKECREPGQ